MARELMLLVAAVIVCLAPGIHGTAHLSFSNNTQVLNINRTGCGETKLCVETPDNCDPMDTACLFTSVMVHTNASMSSMTYLHVELSGMSTGYIAKGLTMNATMGTMLFVCAQNNGTFFFRTRTLQADGTTHTPSETLVMEIRGSVNGSMIQCEFKVPRGNSSNSMAYVILGRGTTNGTTLGAFTRVLKEGPHDLANPASVVPTVMAAASAPAPAVLFLLCTLIWPVVLRT